MEEHYSVKNTLCLKFSANHSFNSTSIFAKKKQYKIQSIISFLSLLLLFFFSANSINAQVIVTKPNLSIPVCSGFPSSYYPLGDIEINEYYVGDFSFGNSKTLILSAPANFEFQPSIGTISYNSFGNVTPTAISISATTITITYNCDNTNKGDNFTIYGLKIRAINVASTANITRTGGTGTISGLTNGTTLTNTLTSVTGTPPTTANAGSNQTLATCATTTTLSGNAPTYGAGTWSVVSGAATITTPSSRTSGVTGLAIGKTATLRWTISNGVCGTSSSDVTITTTMGPSCLVYCTSSGGTLPNGIKGVVFNTINNTNTAVNVAYSDYTTINTSVTKGNSYNLSIYLNTDGNYRDYQSVWIDWNANGLFTDSGEFYNLGSAQDETNGLSTFSPYSISVPIGASTAAVRMRIQSKFGGATTGSCDTGFYGEVEDYTINIIDPAPCKTPAVKPTSLSFISRTLNSINGSFTIPVGPGADNFLVVANTSGVEPVPVDGTTYTIGSTALGSSNIVVDTDGNNTFTASSLASSRLYYIYVFPFNSFCSGGPLYKTNSPLNGSTTTLAPNYCATSVSNGYQSSSYIKDVNFIGNITNSDNPSTYSSSPLGYQNFIDLGTRATQAQGEGVNVYTNTIGGANYMKAWVDWNSNGVFDESTEVVYQCTNAFINTTFGFKIPETTIPGNYRIRIRINKSNTSSDNTFGACGNIVNYGETEDYLFTVLSNCSTKITSIINGTNCGQGSVTLGATASAGTTSFRWYTAQTGGTYVSTASNTWATPTISTTTTYYVTAFNGSCESLFRTPIVATIRPVPTLTFANANPEVCGENSIIDLQASASNEQVYLIDENFENGLGSFVNNNIASPDAAKTNWQTQTSTYVPLYPTFPVWYPAISSGFGTNKFAMATSDLVAGGQTFGKIENALESGAIDTNGFLNLSLTFKMYFSSYFNANNAAVEFVVVEYQNGPGAWTAIPSGQFLSDVGIGTQFVTQNFNLNALTNITSLKIRIRYKAGWNDGVAVDDIQLFGDKPLSASFQWTSNSPIAAYTNAACTLPYASGTPVSIVYVKPTLTQLEQPNYSFKATANLANGCFTSATINVTNKSNVWKGTTDNDWNKASNWLPATVPTANTCVIIPTGKTSQISNTPDAFAKTVTIKAPTGNLELLSGKNLTVTDNIIVETGATFNVRNSASLIQINNVANTGIVRVERTSSPIKKLDYTYWSSPVSEFTLGGFSSSNSYMYSWIPTVSNGGGNWAQENDLSIMSPGKGFILRSPWGHTDDTAYTATFIGIPNNGTILTPISKGTLVGATDINAEDDEWNLIGNPYPSALDASAFLNLPANVTTIDGTIYVWTHNSQPDAATIDPFYGDYGLNYTENDYASFNRTGAVSTRSSASTGGNAPTGYIASGQSFFVKAANSMTNGTTKNATFNNSMRVGVEGKNSDFFKLTKNNKDESIPKSITALEKHRVWINLTNNSGAFSQTLIGYIQDATQELDRGFDGESFGGNDVSFYSIIPEAQLTIQGRALPFDENDQVSLGYNSEISGDLSIRIDHIDGLFDTQNIYLEDKELSLIHNLKETPYVFKTEKGDFNERFVLRYTDKTLGTDAFSLPKTNEVIVIVNQNVTVQSSNQLIKSITVYDLLARKIDSYKKVNALKYTLNHLNKTTAGLIVKVTLEDDTVVSKKIIY